MRELIEDFENERQAWLAGVVCRQFIPALELPEFSVAVIYMVGSLSTGGIEADSETMSNAKRIYSGLVQKAEAGGFQEADILSVYFHKHRWTPVAAELAAELVECAGGIDAFLDLFDLLARDTESMGLVQ
ncbi:hypothetical protein [Janthinobacterium aquaticum]|uniref:hypothetical protein n=1 Tax=Janthinobacterium sp. FT58W TaxID=2654254 RepID=UPI00126552F6|nr:hypothetical protein [Janthinobacterium sp. FT58W]KAB8042575.1 hypothetical protein GCM43_13715 [Janthinobacterium sp. FT58W]